MYSISATYCSTWGLPFVVVMMLGSAIYVGGFVAYAHGANGTPLGVEALPHCDHWLALHSLVVDGVAFTRARLAGYETVEDTVVEPDAEVQREYHWDVCDEPPTRRTLTRSACTLSLSSFSNQSWPLGTLSIISGGCSQSIS